MGSQTASIHPFNPEKYTQILSVETGKSWRLHEVVHLLGEKEPMALKSCLELVDYLRANRDRSDLQSQAKFIRDLILKQFRNPVVESSREMVNNSLDAQTRTQSRSKAIDIRVAGDRFITKDGGGGIKDLITFLVPGRSSNPNALFQITKGLASVTGRFGQGIYSYFSPLLEGSRGKMGDAFYFVDSPGELVLAVEVLIDDLPHRLEFSSKRPQPACVMSRQTRANSRYVSITTQGNGETLKMKFFPTDTDEILFDMAVRKELKRDLEGSQVKIRSPQIRSKCADIQEKLVESFAFVPETPLFLNKARINSQEAVNELTLARNRDGSTVSLSYTPFERGRAAGTLLFCEAGRAITSWPITGQLIPEKIALSFPMVDLSQERQSVDFKGEPYFFLIRNCLKSLLAHPTMATAMKGALLDCFLPLIKECNLVSEFQDLVREVTTNDGAFFIPNLPELGAAALHMEDHDGKKLEPVYIHSDYFLKLPLPTTFVGMQYLYFVRSNGPQQLMSLEFHDRKHILVPAAFVPSQEMNNRPRERFRLELIKEWALAALKTPLNHDLIKETLWPYKDEKAPSNTQEGAADTGLGEWVTLSALSERVSGMDLSQDIKAFIVHALSSGSMSDMGIFSRDLDSLCHWLKQHGLPKESQEAYIALIQRLCLNSGHIDLEKESFPDAHFLRVNYPTAQKDALGLFLDYQLTLPPEQRDYFVLHVKYHLCNLALSRCNDEDGLMQPADGPAATSSSESAEQDRDFERKYPLKVIEYFEKMVKFTTDYQVTDRKLLRFLFSSYTRMVATELDQFRDLLTKLETKERQHKAITLIENLSDVDTLAQMKKEELQLLFDAMPDHLVSLDHQEKMQGEIWAHPCPEKAIIDAFLLLHSVPNKRLEKCRQNCEVLEAAVKSLSVYTPYPGEELQFEELLIKILILAEEYNGSELFDIDLVQKFVRHVASLDIPQTQKAKWVRACCQLQVVVLGVLHVPDAHLFEPAVVQGFCHYIGYMEEQHLATDGYFQNLEAALTTLTTALRKERSIKEIFEIYERFQGSNSPHKVAASEPVDFLQVLRILFTAPWRRGEDPIPAINLRYLVANDSVVHLHGYIERWIEKLEAESLLPDTLRAFFYAAVLGTPIEFHINPSPSISVEPLQERRQLLHQDVDVLDKFKTADLALIRIKAATKQSLDPHFWVTEIVNNALEAGSTKLSFDAYLDADSTLVLKVSDNGHGMGPEEIRALKLPGNSTRATGENYGWGFYSVFGYWPEVFIDTKAADQPGARVMFLKIPQGIQFAQGACSTRSTRGSELIFRKPHIQNPRDELVKLYRRLQGAFRHYPGTCEITFQGLPINLSKSMPIFATHEEPYKNGTLRVDIMANDGGIYCKKIKMPDPAFDLLRLVPEEIKRLLEKRGAKVRIMLPTRTQLMNRSHLADESDERQILERATLVAALRFFQQTIFSTSHGAEKFFDTDFLFDFRNFQAHTMPPDAARFLEALSSRDYSCLLIGRERQKLISAFLAHCKGSIASGKRLVVGKDASSDFEKIASQMEQAEIGSERRAIDQAIGKITSGEPLLKYILLEMPLGEGKSYRAVRDTLRSELVAEGILNRDDFEYNSDFISAKSLEDLSEIVACAIQRVQTEIVDKQFDAFLCNVLLALVDRCKEIQEQKALIVDQSQDQTAAAVWLKSFLASVGQMVWQWDGKIEYFLQASGTTAYVLPSQSKTVYVNLASREYRLFENWYMSFKEAKTEEERISSLLDCERVVLYVGALAHELTHLDLEKSCVENVHDERFMKVLALKINQVLVHLDPIYELVTAISAPK